MRKMKDSGFEWIGEIPEQWEIGRIKDYCDIKTGSTPNTKITEWFDGDVQWFTPGDFSDNFILEKSSRTLSQKSIDDNLVCLFPEQTIMLIGIGGTAGKVGVTRVPSYCNQQITALIPRKIYSKHFMYWLVANTDALRSNALYTTLPIINNQTIGNYVCVIPNTYKEQKEIADYLDMRCSEIDSLVSDIQKQIDTLEEYKRSVITEAVTNGLDRDVEMRDSGVQWIGMIPKHWKVDNPKWHFVQRKDRATKGLVQLTASQKYGVVTQDEYMELTGAKIVTVEKDFDILKLVCPGDFIIHMRSFQGGLEYSEKYGSISSAYVMLIPQKTILEPRYYKWFFKSPVYIDALSSTTNLIRDGQAMRYANFIQLPIILMPEAEQRAIADYLDEKCTEIDSIISEKKRQIETIEEYKKSLIFEYVTGKKEVTVE